MNTWHCLKKQRREIIENLGKELGIYTMDDEVGRDLLIVDAKWHSDN